MDSRNSIVQKLRDAPRDPVGLTTAPRGGQIVGFVIGVAVRVGLRRGKHEFHAGGRRELRRVGDKRFVLAPQRPVENCVHESQNRRLAAEIGTERKASCVRDLFPQPAKDLRLGPPKAVDRLI